MIFNEFKNTMDNQTSKINGENTLFWKLWLGDFRFQIGIFLGLLRELKELNVRRSFFEI